MAAERMTNRQIARSLYLSLEAVEMQLSQIYRKLGIGSRNDVARALPRQLAEALRCGLPARAPDDGDTATDEQRRYPDDSGSHQSGMQSGLFSHTTPVASWK